MTNLKIAPLNAATVISLRPRERIPASHRPRLLDAVRQAGQALRAAIRQAGDDAIQEMRKRGLQLSLDAPTIAQWRLEAQKAYPKSLLLDSGVVCSRVVCESQLIFKALEK